MKLYYVDELGYIYILNNFTKKNCFQATPILLATLTSWPDQLKIGDDPMLCAIL